MDFCEDGTGNGRLKIDSGDFFRLFDKMPARIGDRLGGGKIFKWFGVKERRLPSDAVYGDWHAEYDGIGDNGNNGEFGVWTRVYADIFFLILLFLFLRRKISLLFSFLGKQNGRLNKKKIILWTFN